MENEKESIRHTPRKKKINRVSIVDQVCAAIKQDVVDGIWKPGDKLPSEAELADTFGVNRLSDVWRCRSSLPSASLKRG